MALGGGNFTAQNKVLPGAYLNFVSASRAGESLAKRGVVALPLELDWGIEGSVFTVDVKDLQNKAPVLFGYAYGDDKLKGLRDLFKHARKAHLYRLNNGGTKAMNTYATAIYSGTRGNAIKIAIEANEAYSESNKRYDISTYFDGARVDMQSVKAMTELKNNAYVTFKTDAALVLTAGVNLNGGTNGTVSNTNFQAFLDKIESYSVNVIGCLSTESTVKALFAAFTKRMRDEVGVKFQCVLHKYEAYFMLKTKDDLYQNKVSAPLKDAANKVTYIDAKPATKVNTKSASLPSIDGVTTEKFTYDKAPAYANKYQNQISDLAQNLLSREKFSYDPETDPTYQQYKTSYTKQGQRAMQDTIGQVSARTGGLASSYAGAAGQQTYDGYMSALSDKLPELRQLAYSMYQDEGNNQRSNLQMLMNLENSDYGKYQNDLNQYNNDRNFDYGVYNNDKNFNYGLYTDDRNYNYQVGRNQISDNRYNDETSYNRQTYKDETTYNRAMQKAQALAEAGDFSGYKAMGYSDAQIANMKAAYAKEQAAALLIKSGGSSGRSNGSGSKKSLTYNQSDASQYDSYQSAVEYMKNNGVSDDESNGLMTEQKWTIMKQNFMNTGRSYSNKYPEFNYATYDQYRKAYVDDFIEESRG